MRCLILSFLWLCFATLLFAEDTVIVMSHNELSGETSRSSVVFNIQTNEMEYYRLYNATTNELLPIIDPSRQFMPPGEYKLSYQKFGNKIYIENFRLRDNQDLVIKHQPVPVDPQLTANLRSRKRSTSRNLYLSVGSLAIAGLAKYLGDSAYSDYQAETDPSKVIALRDTCEIYQIACFGSAGLSLAFLGRSVYSFFETIEAKKDIRQNMNR
jgi:hypothetical protein